MADPPIPAGGAPFVDLLVAFGHQLRDAGMTVGSGDLVTYCAAAAVLDPADLLDLYWAGRTTLVTRRDQIATYDRTFRRFFLDQADDLPQPWRHAAAVQAESVLQVPATEPGAPGQEEEQEAELGLMASSTEVARTKSFAACTPEELAALRRIMTRIRLVPPRRCTRRTVPGGTRGTPDLRRTIRATLRTHGEPGELFRRRRRLRMRPIVLILDISGSMADYSRNLLQFAHSTRRAGERVEVFCFGTRLTRITTALARRRADDALADAARAVVDWEGGTRIGESLDQFVRRWGRQGMSRGGIVVICSDGLDRGDPAVLDAALQRLARQSHRIVWLNPHKGDDRAFTPNTLGMMVAAPHVDLILSGHDLRSLEDFAARLPGLR